MLVIHGRASWGRSKKMTRRQSLAAVFGSCSCFSASALVVAFSSFGVKQWSEFAGGVPPVDDVRPSRCPCCFRAARAFGESLGVVGHGKRERMFHEVVGLLVTVFVVFVRRFLCVHCGRTFTVAPAGTLSRRRYTVRAIVLAIVLRGLKGFTAREVRDRVAVTDSDEGSWPQLRRWVCADWPQIDGLPRGSPGERAEKIAQYFVGLAPSSSGLGVIESAVQGAGYLRQKQQ